MKKVIVLSLAICFLAVALSSLAFAGWDPGKAEQQRKAAEETIAKFKRGLQGSRTFGPIGDRHQDHAHGYLPC